MSQAYYYWGGVADALSRRLDDSEEGSELNALIAIQPTWLSDIADTYKNDPKAQELLLELSVNPGSLPQYTYSQGIIKYKGRVYVGSTQGMRLKLIECMHNSLIGDIQALWEHIRG